MPSWPSGFAAHAANAGVKDDTPDFAVVVADRPCTSAAVFTQSTFAGASVEVSRSHAASGHNRGVVVVSKNANVATGAEGRSNAEELVSSAAAAFGLAAGDLLVASTGVIGRQYPMDRLRAHLASLGPQSLTASVDDVARAIMTTDTRHKVASATAGAASVVGVAKGVGMIEPDMATLLVFVFTDAEVPAADLDALWRAAVDVSFNSLSIDTDTSTSDTAAVFASGAAGPVDHHELGRALAQVCLDLTRQLARDGEGATKLLEVTVVGAADHPRAKRLAKAVVNSPLVKTAVHGADPNWGRVAMAIGKVPDEPAIGPDTVTIRFGDLEVYPRAVGPDDLARLAEIMAAEHVVVHVSVGDGPGTATVYGCDLSREYVHINADYTT